MEDFNFKIPDSKCREFSKLKPVNVSVEQVRKLRTETGYGMMMCKKALEEAKGDESLAIEMLKRYQFWII